MNRTWHFEELGWSPNPVDYEVAWAQQREIHAKRVADEVPDTVIFLEHDVVYTAGKRTEDHERPTNGAKVVDVDRGGKITYHGPGQLVAYPIVELPDHIGVVDYVRRLEEIMIRTLADIGIDSGRVEGRSGVWLAGDAARPERKIGAIGIRVSHNVTMHGLSLNADPDMSHYDTIVACGIADAGVTSIRQELGQTPSPAEMSEIMKQHLVELLSWEPFEYSTEAIAPRQVIRVLGVG